MILGWNHCFLGLQKERSAITESPKVGITKSHMHLKTWWTASYFAVRNGWPVSLRIDYKILLLTFKCIYGLAPTYLSDLISIKSNSL